MSNEKKEIAVKSQSERFTEAVIKEFTSEVGVPQVNQFQRRLIQNYFMKLNGNLKDAEKKRMMKTEATRDAVPVTWENINMQKLAEDVVSFSMVGLDPAQKNHVNLIPYKNNLTKKYDVTFITGYKGTELIAMRFGMDIPDNVVVELVYETDTFKVHKKNRNNTIEGYDFEVNEPFKRGEIIGGFYAYEYSNPLKNKVVFFPLDEILKRKPAYASPEFWGGEKTKYKDGKPDGKEKIDGWYKEMCYKTVYRAAFGAITIDSEKINDHVMRVVDADLKSTESHHQQLTEDAEYTEVDPKQKLRDSKAEKPSIELP